MARRQARRKDYLPYIRDPNTVFANRGKRSAGRFECLDIVTCIPIARQRLVKHIPATNMTRHLSTYM
jgi:hypothetical protein